MPRNLVRRTFYTNGTWTAPAGVTNIVAMAFRNGVNQVTHVPQGVTQGGSVLAILANGDMYSFGANNQDGSGVLGDNTTVNRSSPVLVVGGFKWTTVSGGYDHVFGIDTNQNAYGWGWGNAGQLGTNTSAIRSSPVLVAGSKKWLSITGSISGGGGIDVNGDAYMWDANGGGIVGDGTSNANSSPLLVVGGKKWRLLSASTVAIGIDSNGDMYGWGTGSSGQIGDSTTNNRSSPVLVAGGLKFAYCHAGRVNSYGITTSGDLYGWGSNGSGQIGDNTTTNRSSPVLIVGSKKWKVISSINGGFSKDSTLAIDVDGNLYGWGDNSNGQLGDNTTVNRSSPVLVAGGKKWSFASVAEQNSSAVDTDGNMYSWGQNTNGALGTNSAANTSSPVLVVGSKLWNMIEDTMSAEVSIPVIPGTAYAVTLIANNASFGSQSLATNPTLTKIVLEYYA